MNTEIREFVESDIATIVDYFLQADAAFLRGMGADKDKLPSREKWIQKLTTELDKPYPTKKYHYIIWLRDGQAVGHSNVNHINYGESATR